MVGLSVVLEGQDSHLDTASNGSTHTHGQQPQLVNNNNKAPMVIHQTDIPSSSLIPYSPKNYNPPAPTASPSLFPAGRETDLPYSSTFRLPPVFLDCCCYCKAKLMPGRDIYMYKGDGGFCSVECRCRQISLDEQADVIMKKKNKKKKKKHCKTC